MMNNLAEGGAPVALTVVGDPASNGTIHDQTVGY
jgi:hypothetical protein